MYKTIVNMLKTLVQENKSSWKDHLNKLVYAYDCTKHSTTGYSLFYLLFGRNPQLPVDSLLTHDTDGTQRQTLCIDKWKKAMEEAYNIAVERSPRRKERDVKGRQRKIQYSFSYNTTTWRQSVSVQFVREGRNRQDTFILTTRDPQSN